MYLNISSNSWCHYPSVSANCLEADKSNTNLYVGHDNGFIGVVNIHKNEGDKKLFKAHDGAVNAVGINLTNSDLYSVGSDGMLAIWQ